MLLGFVLACRTDSTAPDDPPPTEPAAAGPEGALARLSHVQWHNTTVDLLQLTGADALADDFVGDAATSWFDNDRGGLAVDATLWLQYQAAAEELAARVTADEDLLWRVAPERDRDTWIRSFGERAFRRPLTAGEIVSYTRLFDEGSRIFRTDDAFADGVHAAIAGFLQSPSFLYRTLGFGGPGDGLLLEDFEFASKLSYGLWNTMPDPELLEAAERGFTDEVIVAEVRRMLADPRARAMIRDLHRQWLHIDNYKNIDRSVEENHADYRLSTPFAMETEVYAFVDGIVFGGGTVGDLFTSRETVVESRLADIYGIPDIEETEMVPVSLDPDERAGLFTLSGFLAMEADGSEPSLINRGAFLNAAVLCVDIPPPPPNVPPIGFDDQDMTLRDRIDEHTRSCGGACHNDFINPIGFAFGVYDATGRYQTRDDGLPIDPSGTYAFEDGPESFGDAVELSELLAVHPQVHRCYVSHLLAYAEGRSVTPGDSDRIEALAAKSLGGQPILDLMYNIVTDEAFRRRPLAAE